mmetsp:Transcript_24746/g.66427  ORF Transcript_24746/g.66427 Transcript_24746/m.66427 type:complete len:379 (-) Transcript_24746:528-1664(-)
MACLGGVDQVGHRGHDDRGEAKLGEELKGRREDEQDEHHQHAGDGAGEVGLAADHVVDGGAREGAGDGVAGGEGSEDVCDAEREELLARDDLVLVLGGEALGDGDGLHVADEARRERRAHAAPDLGEVKVARPRRETARDVADNVLLLLARVAVVKGAAAQLGPRGADEDADRADDQRRARAQPREPLVLLRRLARGPEHEPPEQAHHERVPLGLVDLREEVLDRLVEVLRLGDRVADEILELREPDDDGRSRREARHDGVAEERDQEAETEEGSDRLEDADEQRRQDRQLGVRVGAQVGRGRPVRLGECPVLLRKVRGALVLRQRVRQANFDEERDHRDGPDGELARRAEECVRDDRDHRRVEAVLHVEACDVRVRH